MDASVVDGGCRVEAGVEGYDFCCVGTTSSHSARVVT